MKKYSSCSIHRGIGSILFLKIWPNGTLMLFSPFEKQGRSVRILGLFRKPQTYDTSRNQETVTYLEALNAFFHFRHIFLKLCKLPNILHIPKLRNQYWITEELNAISFLHIIMSHQILYWLRFYHPNRNFKLTLFL